MTRTVDYYFSLISPWTYLGDARLRAIAAGRGARVVHVPVKLGEVFPATGGLPLPKRSKQRQDYRLVELDRWRRHLGLPLNLHPTHFPADESTAAGMVIAANARGADVGPFVNAVLSAVWAEEKNIADPDTLLALAAKCGLDGPALLAEAAAPATQEAWSANSAAAIERGVFGSPFYFVGDEPFWGQDRLEFVDRALA